MAKIPAKFIDVGTGADTVCVGNDARLSNARTPTAHAASHVTGQADALTPANIGAIAASVADANSLLYAVTDNTPAALALAANQFAARGSTGNIVAKAVTDAALALLDDASASDMLTTIGAASASHLHSGYYQPLSTYLGQIAAITPEQGDILYRNASGWVALNHGTAGQYLKTGGHGADPAWDTPAGSGIPTDTLHANSILYAIADHTPAQLLLAANQFAARASTGDIAAKSITDAALTVMDDTTVGAMLATLGGMPLPATPEQGDVLYFDGSAWAGLTHGTDGQALVTKGHAANPQWATISAGAPGGSNTQVQFNDGSVFAGAAHLAWNKTTNVLTGGYGSGGEVTLGASLNQDDVLVKRDVVTASGKNEAGALLHLWRDVTGAGTIAGNFLECSTDGATPLMSVDKAGGINLAASVKISWPGTNQYIKSSGDYDMVFSTRYGEFLKHQSSNGTGFPLGAWTNRLYITSSVTASEVGKQPKISPDYTRLTGNNSARTPLVLHMTVGEAYAGVDNKVRSAGNCVVFGGAGAAGTTGTEAGGDASSMVWVVGLGGAGIGGGDAGANGSLQLRQTTETGTLVWGIGYTGIMTGSIQQAHIADPASASALTQDTLTDSSGGTAGTTIAAIGATYSQSEVANAVASICAQLAKVKADVAAVRTGSEANNTAIDSINAAMAALGHTAAA